MLKNTFLSFVVDEAKSDVHRRRACSERPRRQDGSDADFEMDLQLQRLGRCLECPRQSQTNQNVGELSKLPLASQLALSSLASMGMMALQQRLVEADRAGVAETKQCAKVCNLVRTTSSDSVSTMVPEESDCGSEGVSSARPRPQSRQAEVARPRAKVPVRSRRETRKAATAQKQVAATWGLPDVSSMFVDGAWVSPEQIWGAEAGLWGSWSQQATAAQAWNTGPVAAW